MTPAGKKGHMFETCDVVAATLPEVWAWHARPGALHRLAPPWQHVTVRQEAASLRDGRSVLGLPAGIRWVASHQPDAYEPERAFADQLTSFPLAPVLQWRHEHRFEAVDDDHTRVTDRVSTRLPDAMLRPMFAYRRRQLADDLAAHRWAAALRPGSLTVAVTGSSGLIGTALCALLTTGGHRVIHLVRRPPRGSGERQWDPAAPAADLLDGVDALVHLAGAPIAGRFSDAHKAEIRDSRIDPTARLAELVAAAPHAPVMVSASAVGFYGPDRGDELLTEDSGRGDGFLADVVADWEAATAAASDAGRRVVMVRTGIVQTPSGGTLRVLRPIFETGLGGRLGDGRQWTAWIGIDDLIDIYLRAIVDDRLSGPVNAVGPQPERNADYSTTLARVLHRPSFLPTPSFGPRLLLGSEGAEELALAGQRALPTRLQAIGHPFRFTALEPALRHLLGHAA